jgi:hypothetical protein
MTYPAPDFWANLAFLTKLGIGSFFPIWAVRSKYELDKPLDSRMQACRWLLVLAGLTLASIPGRRFGPLLGLAGFVGWAVLLWPNLVYHAFARASGNRESVNIES